MNRILPIFVLSVGLCVWGFAGLAYGQAPSSSVISSPSIVAVPDDNGTTAAKIERPETSLVPDSVFPDLPPLPNSKATLIGGTIEKMDRVQDQITVHVFGGSKMKVLFDTRTHIYRDGALVSAADLKRGDRVYLDTVLDGNAVFARNIRLKTSGAVGETQGVILSYRGDRGELQIRDRISPRAFNVRISGATRIIRGEQTGSARDLVPGTLIAVKFGSESDGRDLAREVSVLAAPGSSFTFSGQVIAVDLRTGLLVLTSTTNRETYEIHLEPSLATDGMRNGATVTVLTRFDGNHYVARSVTIDKPAEISDIRNQ